MHVLIVGINGFLGRTLASHCQKQGIQVTGVYHTNKIAIPRGCVSYPYSRLKSLRDEYDAVFMLAAAIPYPGRVFSDDELQTVNTRMPLAVALQFSQSFLVFASSVSIYGQPRVACITEKTHPHNPNQYGVTKLAAESLLERSHTKTAILRFSSLYGRGMYHQTFLPRIIGDAQKKKVITLFGDGTRKQDYFHVSDAAKLCLAVATQQKTGTYLGVFGTSYSNHDVAELVAMQIPGCRIEHSGVDASPSYVYDASFTKKTFHFVPSVSLARGIEGML